MLIEAKSMTRSYGRGGTTVTALDAVSFDIAAGEFVAIMGPSGSGKSTLMNLIGLLDSPTSGKLVFKGKDVTRLSHDALAGLRNREIGFVFQSYNLLARHTALENVEIPLIYAGISRRKRLARARAALGAVGLSHRESHGPGSLSGGEQQRVAIARALVNEPALVLADEPTGALDSKTGLDILALFKQLNLEGRTIVMITHDEDVAAHAQRVLRLRDGKLIDDPTMQESRTVQPLPPAAPSMPQIQHAHHTGDRS